MSNNVQVNALGDACPIPVVKTIKALAALGGAGTIETLVDNEVAVENLKRLASEKGCGVSVEKAAEKEWHV
ncbi:sulfurtransferase TusA family protein, partial [Paratractidigestivibacter sp.]